MNNSITPKDQIHALIGSIQENQNALKTAEKAVHLNINKLTKEVNTIATKLWKQYFNSDRNFTYSDGFCHKKPFDSLSFEGGCHTQEWQYEPLSIIGIFYNQHSVWMRGNQWMTRVYDTESDDYEGSVIAADVPFAPKVFRAYLKELSEILGIRVVFYIRDH